VRNLKAIVEYDGTTFVGWQRQETGPSVQEAVENAIHKITQKPTRVRVAGRTDAGVHAHAQVFNFRTESKLPTQRLAAGINAMLPRSVSIHQLDEVHDTFDAKRDSLWKRYRYSFYLAQYPSAHEARTSLHIKKELDVEAIQRAAQHLIGEKDFESFRAIGCQAEHARRHMMSIQIEKVPRPPAGHLLHITYQANAFVQHMCRILSGTLLEVGKGERDPDSIKATLTARQRTSAGVTAPPHGLCLLEVHYPPPPTDADAHKT
jgi:tRNA pseudouridine38-40 synthase